MLSMPLENLHLLDNVSGSVGKARIHRLSRSMRNIRSVEAPLFDGLEETSFDLVKGPSFDDGLADLHQINTPACVTMSEQEQGEKRAPLLPNEKRDWSLGDANQLISYAFQTNSVGVV